MSGRDSNRDRMDRLVRTVSRDGRVSRGRVNNRSKVSRVRSAGRADSKGRVNKAKASRVNKGRVNKAKASRVSKGRGNGVRGSRLGRMARVGEVVSSRARADSSRAKADSRVRAIRLRREDGRAAGLDREAGSWTGATRMANCGAVEAVPQPI